MPANHTYNYVTYCSPRIFSWHSFNRCRWHHRIKAQGYHHWTPIHCVHPNSLSSTMYYSKSLVFIGVALVAGSIEAFVLISPSRAHSSLDALRYPNDERGATSPDAAIRHITATSALALGLLFPTVSLAAQDTTYQVPTAMQSSSVQVRHVYVCYVMLCMTMRQRSCNGWHKYVYYISLFVSWMTALSRN